MKHSIPARSPARQRGAAALIVTSMLFLAMALVSLFTSRSLLVEQRSATNQIRAAQAFEAAEAGLEWALAQLGTNRRIDDSCESTTDATAGSFRSRYLQVSTRAGDLAPRLRDDTAPSSPLQAACMRTPGGWSCSCPSHGAPSIAPMIDVAPTASFVVRFEPAAGRPGVVNVGATGCTGAPTVCFADPPSPQEAVARLEVAVGLIGGLRIAPAAAVTMAGRFDAGAAAIGLHNADPLTGIAIIAGDEVIAPAARISVPAGASIEGAVMARDPALAGLDASRFFSAAFGLDKRAWRQQPAVIRVDCPFDCSAAMGAAISAAPDDALIHVDGDLHLQGPLDLGSASHPVVIVAKGTAHFDGAIALTGVLHAAALQWNGNALGAGIRGALLLEGEYRGDAAPDLVYDARVLERLRTHAGSFARIPGSWRDF